MTERVIYDVGMNTGEDTARYLAADYKVLGIEADPILCRICRERFAREIEEDQLLVLEVAIAPQNGPMSFWRNRTKLGWSSIHPELGMRVAGGDMVTVNGIRFEEILREYGMPWYLKSDIEGADFLCLDALRAFKVRPTYISVELANEEWPPLLLELGYKQFALVDQAPFNANNDHPDLPEVSGPIPTEIEEWVDLKTIMEQFKKGQSWYDIYAKKGRKRQ